MSLFKGSLLMLKLIWLLNFFIGWSKRIFIIVKRTLRTMNNNPVYILGDQLSIFYPWYNDKPSMDFCFSRYELLLTFANLYPSTFYFVLSKSKTSWEMVFTINKTLKYQSYLDFALIKSHESPDLSPMVKYLSWLTSIFK